MRVNFLLNDERYILDIDAETTILAILRKELGQKSIHAACSGGQCGSCLILVNNQAVPSCLMPAFLLRDATVETIEGLSSQTGFADIEKAFLKTPYTPCAYCAPSKVILTESLLRSESPLTSSSIGMSIPKHWCNCNQESDFIAAVLMAKDLRKKRELRPNG